MPPTRLFVSNAPVLGVEFTLGSASHTCEEPLKQGLEVTMLERKDKKNPKSPQLLSFSEGCGSETLHKLSRLEAWRNLSCYPYILIDTSSSAIN